MWRGLAPWLFQPLPAGAVAEAGAADRPRAMWANPAKVGLRLRPLPLRAEAAAARGRGAAPGMPGGPGRGPRKPDFLMPFRAMECSMRCTFRMARNRFPPIPFLPANANARQLTVINEVVYAATSHGCGGAPNGVWALDIATKEVAHWTPPAGDIAGDGFAFGPDEKIYAATTSGDLVALESQEIGGARRLPGRQPGVYFVARGFRV